MIFDAKNDEKDEGEVKKMASKIAAKSKAPPASSSAKFGGVAKHITDKSCFKISKSLRNSGLSQLIGKISARASKNSIQIERWEELLVVVLLVELWRVLDQQESTKRQQGKNIKSLGFSTTGRGGGGSGSGIGGGLSTGVCW